jgi:hypothetical protein
LSEFKVIWFHTLKLGWKRFCWHEFRVYVCC